MRVAACGDSGPGRNAQWTGAISVAEHSAGVRQPVQIWGLDDRMAIGPQQIRSVTFTEKKKNVGPGGHIRCPVVCSLKGAQWQLPSSSPQTMLRVYYYSQETPALDANPIGCDFANGRVTRAAK